LRVFVAIDLPDAVLAVLEDLQDQLPVGRLMEPETLHLTLAFLGDQPRDVILVINEELSSVRATPFEVELRGVGTFGGRQPSVLWTGLRPQPALGVLRDRVRSAVRMAGVELPRERFRPHVTLARFPARMRGDELHRLRNFLVHFGDVALPSFGVDGFTLFESRRTSEGAIHDALEYYLLDTGSMVARR